MTLKDHLQQVEEDFEKEVDTLQQLSNQLLDKKEADSDIVRFGYKTIKDDEIYTITDWKNIKTFLSSSIRKVVESVVGEVVPEKEFIPDESTLYEWRRGYNQAIDDMKAKLKEILEV